MEINAAKARSKCKEPAVAANGGEMTPKNDPAATSCSLTLTFYLKTGAPCAFRHNFWHKTE